MSTGYGASSSATSRYLAPPKVGEADDGGGEDWFKEAGSLISNAPAGLAHFALNATHDPLAGAMVGGMIGSAVPVVGTGVEPGDLVDLLAARGEQDDRQRVEPADAPAHLDAVAAGLAGGLLAGEAQRPLRLFICASARPNPALCAAKRFLTKSSTMTRSLPSLRRKPRPSC